MKEKVENVVSVLVIVLLVLWMIFFSIFYVSGSSMYDTIHDKDTLVVFRGKAECGDIVVIYSDELDKKLCKRVIGMEGDHIEIKDGIVYRNGGRLEEPYNKDTVTNLDITVGKGEVFVLGDNRNNSVDSRRLGCIPEDNISGVVVLDTHIPGGIFKAILILLIAMMAVWLVRGKKKSREI